MPVTCWRDSGSVPEAMLKEAGFADIRRTVLPNDPMNVWFVSRKG